MKLHLPPVRVTLALLLCPLLATAARAAAPGTVVYEPKDGPGKGKHVVFLTGDEEYRSEEGLPMLARVLSQRHGFKCTVLFPLGDDGTINPDNTKSLPGAEALDTADAIVMLLRFRAWPDEQMKHFVDAYRRGVPIVALRTSTHAFKYDGPSQFREFNSFGKRVVGEDWVSHWGNHKKEATKGLVEPGAENDPVLRGVTDVFGDSDVYEAHPPADAKVLLRGQVLKGMNPTDPPADYRKKNAKGREQGVNDPMMPVAWTRTWKNEAGKENRVFTTTLGAATDLQSEGLRRLIVNAVYWGLGMEVPQKADVSYVGEYKPTMYGFGGYRKGVRPEAHALQAGPSSSAAPTPRGNLRLNKGDHVALIGNALPDRMQHDGHFEALAHAHFPDHDLVFRNLAFAGDEVATRHRSENFGSPDEWLTRVKADVVLAFLGYNESFDGQEGLAKFRSDLDNFLKHTLRQNYSRKGSPRVVLFSPTADEKHQDPNFPDPAANNERLRLYTAAMAEVAQSNGVQFVDLLTPSQDLYASAAKEKKSLTVNSHYLTDEGNRLLAPILFKSLFGVDAPQKDVEKLRLAVNEKNRQWHQRYRTVDGYNVYGGRSKMEYEQGPGGPKLSNYKVMQEEMSQRDVLTANRDKVIWAAARGQSVQPDDSKLPSVTKVRSNKPGPNPDESHPILSAEQSMAKLKLHPGLKANVFADEKQFPQLVNPVQMAWDTKGRLWVAAWYTYPERTPTQEKGDSLLVFEDTDGDGRADTCTPFADGLNCPTGFQFYKDGVLLMQAPDLLLLRDTDGDGRADSKERILMGLDSADSHHTTNSMVLEPGGAVFLSDGVFHRTQVETAWGVVRNDDAAIFRFEPRTGKFQTHIAYGFANPHGRVVDYWGNDLVTDATGNNTYFGPAFSGHIDYPQKHRTLRQFWERPSRPCPGTGILTSRHFPEDWQGNFLNLNVISFQGCYRVKAKPEGSGLWGESLPDLFYSEDPNFRPTYINVGPDGAIYFCDWHNPIIGHLQHHIRDPSRDHAHGRVFRITYEGRPLMKPAKIDGQPVPALLELLKEPENQTRELAKIELDKHDSAEVVAGGEAVDPQARPQGPGVRAPHDRGALGPPVAQRRGPGPAEAHAPLPEPNARAAATKVLCDWRDRVPDMLALLRTQAADESPRVRLEAVRAASFFRTADAVGVVLSAKKLPTDYYLDLYDRRDDAPARADLAQGAGGRAADRRRGRAGQWSSSSGRSAPPSCSTCRAARQCWRRSCSGPTCPEAQRGIALHELSQQRKTTRAGVLMDMIEAMGRTDGARGRDRPAAPAAAAGGPRAAAQPLEFPLRRLEHAGHAAGRPGGAGGGGRVVRFRLAEGLRPLGRGGQGPARRHPAHLRPRPARQGL